MDIGSQGRCFALGRKMQPICLNSFPLGRGKLRMGGVRHHFENTYPHPALPLKMGRVLFIAFSAFFYTFSS